MKIIYTSICVTDYDDFYIVVQIILFWHFSYLNR